MRFILDDGNLTIKFETEFEAAYADDLFSSKMQGKVIKKGGIVQEISIFGKAKEVIENIVVEEIEIPEIEEADFGEVSGTLNIDDDLDLGLEDNLLDETDEELLNMLDDDITLNEDIIEITDDELNFEELESLE